MKQIEVESLQLICRHMFPHPLPRPLSFGVISAEAALVSFTTGPAPRTAASYMVSIVPWGLGLAPHCILWCWENWRPQREAGSPRPSAVLIMGPVTQKGSLEDFSCSGVSQSVSATPLASPWGRGAAVSSLCALPPSAVTLCRQWVFLCLLSL